MLWIIGIILAIVVLGISILNISLSKNEQKAVQIAKDYLAPKYTQEMLYSSVRFSLIEPSLYHVTFSPVNNPELYFVVLVASDLTLREQTNKYGHFIPDDYYLKFFSFESKKIFQENVEKIWGENAYIGVPVDDRGIYGANRIPIELNEKMTAEEMEPFIDYNFYITTNVLFDIAAKNEEAQKILEMIQHVQASQYRPREILFWYLTGKPKEKEVYLDFSTRAEANIEFKNWAEITSIEEIETIMYEQWVSE